MARVIVFGPSPVLSVTIERRPGHSEEGDDVHLHAGGQGVWVSRSAATLGGGVAGRLGRVVGEEEGSEHGLSGSP